MYLLEVVFVQVDSQSNENGQNSTPCGSKIHEWISMKVERYGRCGCDHSCKSMLRLNNVGGLDEHVTC